MHSPSWFAGWVRSPFGGFAYIWEPFLARVNVYIDGFNFYYGVVRNTPYKWLDFRKLSEGLVRAGKRG